MSHQYGIQAAHVHELEVVTGKGDLLVCNKEDHQDLFDCASEVEDALIRGGPNLDNETVVLTNTKGNSQAAGEEKDDELENALIRGGHDLDNETVPLTNKEGNSRAVGEKKGR